MLFPIGIRFDHAGRIAAEFEGDLLFDRVGFQLPTDVHAAGEGQHFDPRITQQRIHMFITEGQEGNLSGRHAAFGQHLAEQQRAEWRLHGRLEDHRVAGGETWRDFVRYEVEREIEGRDAENDAERKTPRQTAVARAGRSGSHFDRMTVRFKCGGSGQFERGLGPLHFALGQRDRLARFGHEQGDKFVRAPADRLGNLPQ